ncbi:MAG: hypothetical protein MH204_11870, partial [Fimbriimonadaceae bacterium]|nr:hypothetical protein [Fimbriimonadaceae bacterium]
MVCAALALALAGCGGEVAGGGGGGGGVGGGGGGGTPVFATRNLDTIAQVQVAFLTGQQRRSS